MIRLETECRETVERTMKSPRRSNGASKTLAASTGWRLARFAEHLRLTTQFKWLFAALYLGCVPLHQAQQFSAVGITEPVLDATLSSAVAGIVKQRHFGEGEAVTKGDVLIELDRRLEELDVTRRKSIYEQAEHEFLVTKALFEKPNSSTPKVDVEKRELEYQVAKVEYELSQEQLARRQVKAPFDGTIAQIFLQVGEACQIQQPVMRLVDARRCYFVCNVDAKVAYNLKTNQDVALEIDAGANPTRITGRISFVSPVVDPASGLLKVKVLFDNSGGAIRPGVSGRMLF